MSATITVDGDGSDEEVEKLFETYFDVFDSAGSGSPRMREPREIIDNM
jgi:hypothetical protein